MKSLSLIILLIPCFGSTTSEIITRHDKADEEYIKFAQELNENKKAGNE